MNTNLTPNQVAALTVQELWELMADDATPTTLFEAAAEEAQRRTAARRAERRQQERQQREAAAKAEREARLANSTEARWKAAVKELRAAGIKVRQNVQKCCRGCISPTADLGLKDENGAYAFTYGGQGGALKWIDGEAWYRDPQGFGYSRERKPYDVAYINFGGTDDRAQVGQAIVDAFRAHGFTVEWDGSEYTCPGVHLAPQEG